MSGNAFGNMAKSAINEAGDNGATNTEAALEHSEPVSEVRTMSRCGHYRDSTRENNVEHSENWKSIGAIAAFIAGKAVRG